LISKQNRTVISEIFPIEYYCGRPTAYGNYNCDYKKQKYNFSFNNTFSIQEERHKIYIFPNTFDVEPTFDRNKQTGLLILATSLS